MLGQLDADEIERLLRCELVGRIGCHAEGWTYVVPITFAYEDGSVYGHTANGLKLRMMRQNPRVCFEVDHVDDPANWRSVIAWGKFEELLGQEADHAAAVLMAKLLPLTITSETSYPSKDLKHQYRSQTEGLPAVTYRIRLTEKTGRFEHR